jgi:hypothetical protein
MPFNEISKGVCSKCTLLIQYTMLDFYGANVPKVGNKFKIEHLTHWFGR